MTYRPNANFFSRTHSFGWVDRKLRYWRLEYMQFQKILWLSAAHNWILVWWHWRPDWAFTWKRTDVQSWCDARPASPRILIIWMISYSSCFDGTDNSKNDGDTYISHPMQHLPRFLRKVVIFLSFLQIASEQLPGIDTWYKQFNYPTTHPAYRAPRHEKVNFS